MIFCSVDSVDFILEFKFVGFIFVIVFFIKLLVKMVWVVKEELFLNGVLGFLFWDLGFIFVVGDGVIDDWLVFVVGLWRDDEMV